MIFFQKAKGIPFALYLSLIFALFGLQSCFEGGQDTYQCPQPVYFKLSSANKAKLGSYFYSEKIEYSHTNGSAIDTQAYIVADTSSFYSQNILNPYDKYGCKGNYFETTHAVLNPTDSSKMEVGIALSTNNTDVNFYFKFRKFDLSVPASSIPTSPDSTVTISSYQKTLGDTLKLTYSGKKGVQNIRTVIKPESWQKIN